MLELRAYILRRLRGPAAHRVLKGSSADGYEEEERPAGAVHRIQPPRVRELEMHDLPPLLQIDVRRRRTVQRGDPTAEPKTAAKNRCREAAVPVRALPLSAT